MLGVRITALRRAKGWSQGELAKRLRISPSTVGMYEQGRREPSTAVLMAMSELFGVTVDYLLTGKTPQQDKESVVQALENLLEQSEVQLALRKERPLSRQELAVLFAALLMGS